MDALGRPIDIRDDFDGDLRQEILLGRRKPDDICWIMSRECWICEMWTYYLPIISKQDIAESFGGLSQNLLQLNEVQEAVFEKIIGQDP